MQQSFVQALANFDRNLHKLSSYVLGSGLYTAAYFRDGITIS